MTWEELEDFATTFCKRLEELLLALKTPDSFRIGLIEPTAFWR